MTRTFLFQYFYKVIDLHFQNLLKDLQLRHSIKMVKSNYEWKIKGFFLPFKAGVPSSKWRIGLACFRLDMILGWNWLKLWQLIKSSSENMISSESHPNIQIRTASIWYQSCWESCRVFFTNYIFITLKTWLATNIVLFVVMGPFFQIGTTVYYMYECRTCIYCCLVDERH